MGTLAGAEPASHGGDGLELGCSKKLRSQTGGCRVALGGEPRDLLEVWTLKVCGCVQCGVGKSA